MLSPLKDKEVVWSNSFDMETIKYHLKSRAGLLIPERTLWEQEFARLKEEAGGIGSSAEVIGMVDANPAIQDNSLLDSFNSGC